MSFDEHFRTVSERMDRQEREVARHHRYARLGTFIRGIGTLIWRLWIMAAVTVGLYIAVVVFQIRIPTW